MPIVPTVDKFIILTKENKEIIEWIDSLEFSIKVEKGGEGFESDWILSFDTDNSNNIVRFMCCIVISDDWCQINNDLTKDDLELIKDLNIPLNNLLIGISEFKYQQVDGRAFPALCKEQEFYYSVKSLDELKDKINAHIV